MPPSPPVCVCVCVGGGGSAFVIDYTGFRSAGLGDRASRPIERHLARSANEKQNEKATSSISFINSIPREKFCLQALHVFDSAKLYWFSVRLLEIVSRAVVVVNLLM